MTTSSVLSPILENTTTTICTKNDDECISPNNRYDDILTNINKSNKRLRYKLSKIPPLPKYSTSCFMLPNFAKNACQKPPYNPNYARTPQAQIDAHKKVFCCKDFNAKNNLATKQNAGSSSFQHMQHTCTRKAQPCCLSWAAKQLVTKLQNEDKICEENQNKSQQQHCCLKRSCCQHYGRILSDKTEPLPWMQQHLVLNQTINANSSNEKQPPVQDKELTGKAETQTTTTTEQAKTSTAKSPATQCFFQELLQRDNTHCQTSHVDCHLPDGKKPRPPVKVDINVRLVPKPAKATKRSAELLSTQL